MMRVDENEKKRILEMHNQYKKPINEGFLDDIWAGLKGIPQGFIYNRTISKIVSAIDKLNKQALRSESLILDLKKLQSEVPQKNIDDLQKQALLRAIQHIIDNHEENKIFLGDLRKKLKGDKSSIGSVSVSTNPTPPSTTPKP